jgi:DNA polymerase-3 subunit gamma/tau
VENRSPAPAAARAAEPSTAGGIDDWGALIARMRLGGVASQLAAHSVLARFEQDELTLHLDPANQALRTATAVERLGKAVSDALGRPVRLNVEVLQVEAETPAQGKARQDAERHDQARQRLEDDPLVRAAGEKLGARLVAESVAPRERRPQDVSD